jgi:4-hydroxybenzoate polyprenyltransferase
MRILFGIARELRPAQWTKNFLVFAGAIFSKRILELDSLWLICLWFALFSAASSTVYLFNDLKDLEQDRKHPVKSKRPLASGELPLWIAWAILIVLGSAVIIASMLTKPLTASLLLSYMALNAAYSLGLKKAPVLEVIFVSAGFLLRVLVGTTAIDVPASPWLILCTLFLSLFLVFAKRRHELLLLGVGAGEHREVLAKYNNSFLDASINVTATSTLLTYALYTVSSETAALTGKSQLIFTVPFVAFGLIRYMYLIYNRREGGDPAELIFSDVQILITALLWLGAACYILFSAKIGGL